MFARASGMGLLAKMQGVRGVGKSIDAADLLGASGGIGIERVLAELLAEVVRAERVSVDGHLLDDPGADSMVIARFCTCGEH